MRPWTALPALDEANTPSRLMRLKKKKKKKIDVQIPGKSTLGKIQASGVGCHRPDALLCHRSTNSTGRSLPVVRSVRLRPTYCPDNDSKKTEDNKEITMQITESNQDISSLCLLQDLSRYFVHLKVNCSLSARPEVLVLARFGSEGPAIFASLHIPLPCL